MAIGIHQVQFLVVVFCFFLQSTTTHMLISHTKCVHDLTVMLQKKVKRKKLFYILKMNDSLINQVNNVNSADTKTCEAAAKKNPTNKVDAVNVTAWQEGSHTGPPPHLDSPEVTWQQEYDGDHGGNETAVEDVTQQVDQDGTRSEEDVEERSQWVSETTRFSFSMASLINSEWFVFVFFTQKKKKSMCNDFESNETTLHVLEIIKLPRQLTHI